MVLGDPCKRSFDPQMDCDSQIEKSLFYRQSMEIVMHYKVFTQNCLNVPMFFLEISFCLLFWGKVLICHPSCLRWAVLFLLTKFWNLKPAPFNFILFSSNLSFIATILVLYFLSRNVKYRLENSFVHGSRWEENLRNCQMMLRLWGYFMVIICSVPFQVVRSFQAISWYGVP